jgi:hypothetical protein
MREGGREGETICSHTKGKEEQRFRYETRVLSTTPVHRTNYNLDHY